jgi:coenzyme F420-dependent glucose-6-phosphate dehydrogenase
MGVVNAPGQRYHPAIIAQAAATLAEMFPERFWIALGSGQALNEQITGDVWPTKQVRNERLKECVDVIRSLWAGETVTHFGHVRVEEATLYTRPKTPPKIFGAALTPETARWVGSWADGLLTGSAPPEIMRPIIDAFREGGGEGKPMYTQANHVYAPKEDGLAAAHDQWRTNVLGPQLQAELRTPAMFDAAAQFVRPEDMQGPVRVSQDAQEHLDWLMSDAELGFDGVFIHLIGRDQERGIDNFGERVLPEMASLAEPQH